VVQMLVDSFLRDSGLGRVGCRSTCSRQTPSLAPSFPSSDAIQVSQPAGMEASNGNAVEGQAFSTPVANPKKAVPTPPSISQALLRRLSIQARRCSSLPEKPIRQSR